MKRSSKQSDIGIVLCDCGGTLTERLDFKRLRDVLMSHDGVAAVKQCSGFCRNAEAERLMRVLAAKQCRRIVIAACSRQIYEMPLTKAMVKARIRPGLVADANLREHCAWVHADRRQATAKAVDLITAEVRRAALATPLTLKKRKVNPHVVVLGGGMAGMQAALRLSELGHSVTLVNRSAELGGCAAQYSEFFGYLDSDSTRAAKQLKQTLASVVERINGASRAIKSDQRIRLIPEASLQTISGEAGQFSVTLQASGQEQTLKAGAMVLAVGSWMEFPFPSTPGGSASGGKASPSSCVMDLAGLAEAVRSGQSLPRKMAILMDIHGEQGRAINALALTAAEWLAASTRRQVTLYCRHIRIAAWGMESLYRRAREAGMVVFRYDTTPTITDEGKSVVIQTNDIQSGKSISSRYDVVIMADLRPSGNGNGLHLPRTFRRGPEGAWQADNVWLLSAKTNQAGIYVIGAARGNSELREAMADADAVAAAIHQELSVQWRTVVSDAAVVDAEKCVLCLTCIRSCPHGAVAVDSKNEAASVSAVACQRCGLCATLCPARAIQLPRFSDDQVLSELNPGPWITAFACENSAWLAAQAAGVNRWEYGPEVRLVRVPCAGRVDERYVLGALERGAGRVMILGCHRENCRYLVGADHALKRMERLRAMLAKAGVDPSRLVMGEMTEFEASRFLEFVKDGGAQGNQPLMNTDTTRIV